MTLPSFKIEMAENVSTSDAESCIDGVNINLYSNKAFVSPLHFSRQNEAEIMKLLVKQSINRVHIEVFSFCNRRCGFCPDAAGSRIKNNIQLPEEYFMRVLEDLREIKYDKLFGFHQYNEPLADRIILKRISQAREYLPEAHLVIHTNGDYLDREYLESLSDKGLNNLVITVYGPNNGQFVDSYILQRMTTLADKLGLTFERKNEVHGHNYFWDVNYYNVTVQLRSINYWVTGYNRGELVDVGPKLIRTSPCFYPFHDLTVDWRGNILPCCNVYPDSPEHEKWITGNLSDGRTIFQHYADSTLVDWRRGLLRFMPKGAPCESCSRLEYPDLATQTNIEAMNLLAEKYIRMY